jgi:hypothetical protein
MMQSLKPIQELPQTALPIQEVMDKIIEQRVKDIKIELKLVGFELLYSVFVSKNKRVRTARLVKSYKHKRWRDALKQAKGDRDKAIDVYANFSSS